MRKGILILIVVGFCVLGLIDAGRGNLRAGVASILLGIVNGLLLYGEK